MSKPKLALIPSGYKSGKVYSILPNDASGDFDFTRQSIGTRVRKDGLIEEAKTVGSITNLQIRSEEFDNSVWTKSNSTVTANDILAPDGTNSADKIVANTSTGNHYVQDVATGLSTSSKATLSVFVKKDEVTQIELLAAQSSSPYTNWCRLRFDLNTLTTFQAPIGDYEYEDFGNGWLRLSITGTPTSSSAIIRFTLYKNNSSNWTGNNIDGFYLWGAMVSEGALSDYIKTEGTTETKRVETFTDVPRLDWLNSNCPSLLLEPQRTNLFGYSEEYDQPSTYWTKTRFTISADAIISPNGTLTADEVFETVDNNNRFLYQNTSVTSGNDYTISFFVKYNNIQYLQLAGSTSFDLTYVNFDILNGEIVRNLDNADARIKDFGNGWYRISLTLEATSTTSGRIILCGIPTSTSSRAAGYIGNTSNSFYLWGGQMEQGSYPTSYIKTEASAVTRLKDECLNGGDSDLFNITEGTFFVDSYVYNSGNQTTIGLSDGSDSNKLILIFQSYGTQVRVFSSGGVSSFLNLTFDQRNKIAVTFKENEYKFFINGVLVGSDTIATVPSGMDRLNFSNRTGTANLFEGKVHDTRVYDRVLTEAEAIELTTL
jgi:hypothetical protein